MASIIPTFASFIEKERSLTSKPLRAATGDIPSMISGRFATPLRQTRKSLEPTFRGVVPFLISDAVRVTLLVAFPSLSLWLVRALS